jgi:hypothetical protein
MASQKICKNCKFKETESYGKDNFEDGLLICCTRFTPHVSSSLIKNPNMEMIEIIVRKKELQNTIFKFDRMNTPYLLFNENFGCNHFEDTL